MPFAMIGGVEQDEQRRHRIECAVLAALMHHKPDYRSPSRLDVAAEVITDFVESALDEIENEQARR